MTTPNQDAPDGAVTIGGGKWNYGQLVNEERAREQFEIEPPSNFVEAVQLLPELLQMIPHEGMKSWQKWLGASDDEVKDGTIVQKIMDSLDKHPLRKLRNRLFHGLNGDDNPDDEPTEDDIYNAALGINTGIAGLIDDGQEIIASGSNLVKNSSFERGMSRQPVQGLFTNDQAFSGTRSLRITSDGLGKSYDLLTVGLTPQTMPALGGDVFYCEVMVRGASSNVQTSGGAGGIQFHVSPFDQSGDALADQYLSLTASTALNDTWTKLSGYLTMPMNTSKARLSLDLGTNVANGSIFYFDQVICREVTVGQKAQDAADGAQSAADEVAAKAYDIIESGSNIVKNSNFERGNAFTGGTFVSTPAYSGSSSLRLTSTGSLLQYPLHTDGLTPKTANAKEGDVFLLEVMVYGSSSNTQTTGGTAGVKFSMQPIARNGTVLAKQSVSLNASTALNGTWTKLSGFVTMPEDSVKAYLYLELDTNVTSGQSYYFDQVVCREVTVAKAAESAANDALELGGDIVASGSNLIKNSDFERGFSVQPSQGTFSTDIAAYSGTTTLKMVSDGAGKDYALMTSGLSPKSTPAKEGDIFYVEAMVWGAASNSQSSGGVNGVRLNIAPSTRLGADLTSQFVALTAGPALKGTWTKLSGYVTMPLNTARAKISLQLSSAVNNSEIYYWDNIIVREVTVAKGAQDTADGTIDAVAQAVDGDGSALASGPATVKSKIRLAFANMFDGLGGTSGNTDKLPSDVKVKAAALKSAADTGVANAAAAQTTANTANSAAGAAQATADTASTTANQITTAVTEAVDGGATSLGAGPANTRSKLRSAWASIWDGLGGTSGTTSKLPSDVKTRAASLNTTATTAAANATAAQTAASTADGKAVAAQNAANTADGKAVAAQNTANTVTSNHSTLVDNITSGWLGDTISGASLANALTAMQASRKDLEDNTKAIQLLRSKKNAAAAKGSAYSVDFSQFSTMAAAGFNVTYSGAGSSTIVISNGVAQWNVADSSSRDAKLIYSQPTATDFQSVRGVMSAPPQAPSGTTPYFYAIARVSPDELNYVWARAYAVSFGNYKADIGYAVGGSETTWVTGISLTWSLDMRFVAGVGTNARQYQIWSGDKVVYTHDESGTSSRLCSNSAHTSPSMHDTSCTKYRQWGAVAQVRNSKVAGKVSGCSVSDNGTPAVNGSTARMHRASTSNVIFTAGSVTALPSSFFDTIPFESQDIDADTATSTFKVSISKPYNIVGRVALNGNVTSVCTLLLQKSSNNGASWTTVQWGDDVYASNGEAIRGNWLQYLNAGDMVRLAYNRGGISSTILTGESSGAQTYFAITGFDLDSSVDY